MLIRWSCFASPSLRRDFTLVRIAVFGSGIRKAEVQYVSGDRRPRGAARSLGVLHNPAGAGYKDLILCSRFVYKEMQIQLPSERNVQGQHESNIHLGHRPIFMKSDLHASRRPKRLWRSDKFDVGHLGYSRHLLSSETKRVLTIANGLVWWP